MTRVNCDCNLNQMYDLICAKVYNLAVALPVVNESVNDNVDYDNNAKGYAVDNEHEWKECNYRPHGAVAEQSSKKVVPMPRYCFLGIVHVVVVLHELLRHSDTFFVIRNVADIVNDRLTKVVQDSQTFFYLFVPPTSTLEFVKHALNLQDEVCNQVQTYA